jgi:hypothetical protein
MRTTTKHLRRLALLAAACAWPLSHTGAQERWSTKVEPYVWVPELTGEGSAEGGPEADLEIDYPGGLSAALPLTLLFDAPGRSSLRLDVLYARWTDDEGSVQTESQLSLLDLGYGYALSPSCDVMAGVRGVELSLDAQVAGFDADASEAWVDPWIGGRGSLPLRGGWSLEGYGDAGGFGVGSDFTWQAIGTLAWSSERWRFDLGYRALAVRFDDDDLDVDMVAHGPILGVALQL